MVASYDRRLGDGAGVRPQAASLLTISGLWREAAMLAGPGRVSICGDALTLSARLAELATRRWPLVLSWGVCGGLDPRLRPGDLVVGSEVVSEDGNIKADDFVTSAIERRLIDAGARVTIERIACASSPVLTARAKAKLRSATGAAVVDMESLMAGRFALAQTTRVAILRAVADPAERDLPPLVNEAVDSDGRINIAGLVRELIRSPGQLVALCAAARDSMAAFKALNRASGHLTGVLLSLGMMQL